MMIDDNVMAVIQKHTQTVDEFLQQNDVENDYGMQALEWIEGYIDRRHKELKQDERDRLIEMIGAFFGECLCRAYSGVWVEDDEQQIGVLMDNILTARPFTKVAKYFAEPSVNSFASMFRSTPEMIKIVRAKQSQADKMDDS